jgi:hypothetical protein
MAEAPGAGVTRLPRLMDRHEAATARGLLIMQ